jgi:hypothetical protein
MRHALLPSVNRLSGHGLARARRYHILRFARPAADGRSCSKRRSTRDPGPAPGPLAIITHGSDAGRHQLRSWSFSWPREKGFAVHAECSASAAERARPAVKKTPGDGGVVAGRSMCARPLGKGRAGWATRDVPRNRTYPDSQEARKPPRTTLWISSGSRSERLPAGTACASGQGPGQPERAALQCAEHPRDAEGATETREGRSEGRPLIG